MNTPCMKEELQVLITSLDSEITPRESSSILAYKVPIQSLLKIMTILKRDTRFEFDQLQLHSALDWPAEQRFEALYILNSTKTNLEVLLTVNLPRENAVLPSLSSIWAIAEWQEREVFDMFGVRYEKHPDLRRIFLDDDWIGFPLRKDYQDEFMLRRPW